MSDTCGGLDIEDIDLTFDDEAAGSLPDGTQCASGTFKPTNFGAGDTFPTATTNLLLSIFDGTNPNGNWTLHMVDDLEGTSVTSRAASADHHHRTVLDPDPGHRFFRRSLSLPGSDPGERQDRQDRGRQRHPSGRHAAVHGGPRRPAGRPNGAKAMILSDKCVGAFVTNVNYTLDDEAATPVPAVCARVRPGPTRPADAASLQGLSPTHACAGTGRALPECPVHVRRG